MRLKTFNDAATKRTSVLVLSADTFQDERMLGVLTEVLSSGGISRIELTSETLEARFTLGNPETEEE